VGYIVFFGTLLVVLALGFWLRRRWADVEDYEEREYKEPPATGDLGHLGGGKL
jgi:hypothetical protein